MKVLVTGGSGFIGSHVVDKLKEKGIDVRVYDLVMPTFRKDIEYYQGSLLDLQSLRMALSGIDAIYHLGAIADVKDVYNEPHYAESINVRGTINILEAARLSGVIKRLIFASTIWVYSDCLVEKVDETTPLISPSHLYTATKLASEHYCISYSKLYGLPTTILRYGIPYGPRARGAAVIPMFVNKALNGEPITIAGDGSQYRNFIYVEDLAEGNVYALKRKARNKIYNLDGNEKVTIKQIAESIKKIVGNVKIEYTSARPGDFSGKDVSTELAESELGWKPRISFEEGLKRYIKWFKKDKEKKDNSWSRLDETLKSEL
ncbi:MAG: NAD-dependent epimerase/dehydratase family protein [SAR202 cluster bacterium]|jgi:UDP-glucose 4-epimerase|nr:NAD-dependent epimerase/dehydratase family protein [SAR202 cluster bacterium]|tara:strand:+ start:7289 stop:8242 length:954 start_codon:yes stop_codon:yes gene_type:complete